MICNDIRQDYKIDDMVIRYLTDENIPVTQELNRIDLGVYNNQESVSGTAEYFAVKRHPFPPVCFRHIKPIPFPVNPAIFISEGNAGCI